MRVHHDELASADEKESKARARKFPRLRPQDVTARDVRKVVAGRTPCFAGFCVLDCAIWRTAAGGAAQPTVERLMERARGRYEEVAERSCCQVRVENQQLTIPERRRSRT